MSVEPRSNDRVWRTAGIAVAVILVIVGLALVAAMVVFVVGMNSWANNK